MVSAKCTFAAVYSWPQKICVSAGRLRILSSDCHIISGFPSMMRPQPTENSVSPTKASFSCLNQ
jgi:hypothetical protein